MLSERVATGLSRYQPQVDGLVAFGLLVVLAASHIRTGLLHVLLTALVVAPMAWRRSRPVISAAAVLGSALLHFLVLLDGKGPGDPLLAADLVVPFAVYSVTAYGPRWAGRAALAAGFVGAVLVSGNSLLNDVEPGENVWFTIPVIFVAFFAPVVVGWMLGVLRGVHREQVEALRERARLLEVERDQQVRLTAAAERARIAREMHDVVAHSLAVMIAQADGGRYAATGSPQAAVAALATIGDTGRTALTEMQRLLGLLRQESGPQERPEAFPPPVLEPALEGHQASGTSHRGADGPPSTPPEPAGVRPPVAQENEPQPAHQVPELAPLPGIADVPALVQQVRTAGVDVQLRQWGAAWPMEPGLGLVAYRIVQEGLTNVLKHAGPGARAEVRLSWEPEAVGIDVLDDGRGVGAITPSGGHGLLGMRERAATFGGVMTAGPRPGGGFAIQVRIPVPA